MQFFILVLIICLFVFLYCVYLLANDDFIFLRRDLTMEKLFNIIFVGSLSCLFFARLFYGLFYSGEIFANPLVFLLFPYFPGLSLLGGVAGAGAVFLYLAFRSKEDFPFGRLADFFSIAFLITLPIGFLGYLMFAAEGINFEKIVGVILAYLILFIIFLRVLLPRLLNGKIQEGIISILFLICFSLINLASNAFPKIIFPDFFRNSENIIFIFIIIGSIFFLLKSKNFFLPGKKIKK